MLYHPSNHILFSGCHLFKMVSVTSVTVGKQGNFLTSKPMPLSEFSYSSVSLRKKKDNNEDLAFWWISPQEIISIVTLKINGGTYLLHQLALPWGSCPGMCLFFQPPNLISHHCSAFNSKVQERAPEAVAWLTLLTELAGSNSDRTPTADSWSRWSLISEQALSSPAALLWRPNGKFYYQVLAFEWELCYKFS